MKYAYRAFRRVDILHHPVGLQGEIPANCVCVLSYYPTI